MDFKQVRISSRLVRPFAAAVFLLTALVTSSRAEDTRTATPCPPTDVEVTAVSPATTMMEGTVYLSGKGFEGLTCSGSADPVVLFLDGLALDDVLAEYGGDGRLRFQLLRGSESKAHWDQILGRPRFGVKTFPISIGLKGGRGVKSNAVIGLVALPPAGFLFGLATFLVLGFLFGRFAVSSNIIRSGLPDPSQAGKKAPFSLAKTQAAWWFFVVLAAYLFIGLVTGDFTTSLNATALTLLAIGGGTALGAALIGASQQTSPQTKVDRAQAAQTVTATLADPDATDGVTAPAPLATTPAGAAAAARVAVAVQARAVLENVSRGFLTDILSDADGVCFHRFQNVAWSVVLTAVFGLGVYENLAMPNFDPTLLGLLGLSSATYLGLKSQEAVVPTVTPQ